MRKFYIHNFQNCYSKGCTTEIRVARLGPVIQPGHIYSRSVRAVCLPYTDGSLKAAWEVFRGRAFAFEWPKPGDLEAIVEDK